MLRTLGSLLLFSTLVGCTGAPDPDADLTLVADSDGKADGITRPLGYYSGDFAGYFEYLDLRADKTYRWDSDVDGSEGTYHWEKHGTHRYIALDEGSTGTYVQHYEYTLYDGQLRVRQTHAPDWQTLAHTGDLGEGCAVDEDSGDYYCSTGLSCTHAGCVK